MEVEAEVEVSGTEDQPRYMRHCLGKDWTDETVTALAFRSFDDGGSPRGQAQSRLYSEVLSQSTMANQKHLEVTFLLLTTVF